jgi:hypothetical protein
LETGYFDGQSKVHWQTLLPKADTPDAPPFANGEGGMYAPSVAYLATGSTAASRLGVGQQWCNSGDGAIAKGEWQHLAVTLDSGSANMRVFIDGRLQSTCDYDGSGIRDTTGPLRIGNTDWQNTGWNGLIDDVRIYERALDAKEIAQLARMSDS